MSIERTNEPSLAQARRAVGPAAWAGKVVMWWRRLRLGELRFDTRRGELMAGDKRVKLTEAERALLNVFALNLGQDMSRDTLARLVGGEVNVRTIDVQVTRLRRKIEDDPKFPRYLQTVRGTGYRLVGA